MITQEWFNGQLSKTITKDSGKYEDYQEGKRITTGVVIGFGKPQLENKLYGWVKEYVNYQEGK